MSSATLGLVIRSTEPRLVIPALLDQLRALGERGATTAEYIEDVYSEVLRGLAENHVPDPAWLDELIDKCCLHLNGLSFTSAATRGLHFGERGVGNWGWWQSDEH